MAGRKPKPTAIKKLAGNPGKRPLNENEPKPGPANVKMPRGVLPKYGQKLWRSLAGRLVELGVLTEIDLPAFEMMCLHYALTRQALDDVEKNGLTIQEEGKTKKNPAMQAFRENGQAYKALLVEFGLTPSSRSRIVTDVLEDHPSLAELLFEGIDDD
jgi:P27 family predicted phage terminase small subunit